MSMSQNQSQSQSLSRKPMGEIKQFDNAKERKSINDLADLYSIIKATETLEAAYSRGAAAPAEYAGYFLPIPPDRPHLLLLLRQSLMGIAPEPLRNRCGLAPELLRNRCGTAAESLRNRRGIAALLCAIAAESLRDRYGIAP
jgi:hypothetical protein